MKFEDLDLSKKYTYADYLTWRFDEYVELIKGKIFRMTPAPTSFHQEILGNLYLPFKTYLKGKQCKVFLAPFDVRLSNKKRSSDATEIISVVQPDICVICDLSKVDEKGCLGAPDLIIEIISKTTAKKDLDDKFHLYEESGVKEYWTVFQDKAVTVYDLINDKYVQRGDQYDINEVIKVGVLEGLEINTNDIFDI
jgi:Uma2 family endonuclease